MFGQGLEGRTEEGDILADAPAAVTGAKEPAGGTAHDAAAVEHQLELGLGSHLVVTGFDIAPQGVEAEYLASHGKAASHLGQGGAGLVLHPAGEVEAHVVDQHVGHPGRDDLAAQRVLGKGRAKLLLQLGREAGHQHVGEEGLVGHLGAIELLFEHHLAIGHQHRQLGSGQSLPGRHPLGELLIGGQEFQRTIQLAFTLQPLDETLLLFELLGTAEAGDRDGLGLAIGVGDNDLRHVVGHLIEHLVALFESHIPCRNKLVQQDLDVDFVIRAIHPAHVVGEVGVDASALAGVLHPAKLGKAQVAALAHNAGTQITTIDPQHVVAAITHFGIALAGALHIGTDAAVPEQVHIQAEQRLDQLVRGHAGLVGTEQSLDLGAQLDGLGRAQEDAAPRGDKFAVVVIPARTRQLEQALALDETPGRIRRRVDEDVHVVEGAHQLGVFREQHAVAEHVPRHVADPDAGEVGGLAVDADFTKMPLDRLPGTTGCDAHLLVVIADRAARGERIAQPVAVLQAYFVGDVGEGGGALVGGND